jgi:predicted amidohydrolase
MTARKRPQGEVNIGLIQTSCSSRPADNLKRTLALIERAARDGAQIICTQELFRSQYFCQAARATVGDVAARVNGAEVAARRHVAALQVEVDAQSLQYAAAYLVLQGVIAEKGDVAGSGARRHPVAHWHRETAHGVGGELVEVRRMRCFELALARLGVRYSTEAIDDAEEDLGIVGRSQLTQQFGVHTPILRRVRALL